jgi:dTDP-4-amino-4,6-dideoxygalactose transaminase
MTAPWPCFTGEEQEAVARVLGSNHVNYWTGQEVRAFEREFAAWIRCDKAIAMANGTLALEAAIKALNIGPGDEVIVTPRTFIASVSCVINAGASPVFADVNRDSGLITPETALKVVSPATRAVIPVHLAGWPCDMPGFTSLAVDLGIAIIEDCAQAHGAKIDGRSVGTFGDIGAWSFCQDKIMTTGGEGGMVNTDSQELWSRMWSYKDHGKDVDQMHQANPSRAFRWVHHSFGSNYRMLELQAVIGRIQLRRMANWHRQRAYHARSMIDVLLQYPEGVRVPQPPPGLVHAYYRLYAYIRPEGLLRGWDRDRVVAALQQAGVPASHGSCSEVYREKAFEGTAFRPRERLPNAYELGESGIAFAVHPTLTAQDLSLMRAGIDKVFKEACGTNSAIAGSHATVRRA